jgi:hypothetical protein
VYLVQVSLLLIGQRGSGDFSGTVLALASYWLEDCANAGGKRPKQRQPLLVQYKQQANPLLSINNYILYF